jgi:hypothetical protein
MKQKIEPIISYFIPRLQDLLFIGIFLFVCTQGFRVLNGDGDLGRHLTIGNYILDHWRIPTHDIFSNTMPGAYLVPHEWLCGVFFALANRALGLSGAVLLSGIVIASAFVIVYKQLINRGVFRLAALCITAWAVLASFIHWQVRPHIFTFLFVAVWISILDDAVNNTKRKIWLLPMIMLLWANMHGGFFLGFLILGAYFAGWAWEYWLGLSNKETGLYLIKTGFWSFIISFLNPAGWHLWITSTGLIGKKFIIDNTNEYLSPNFHIISTWPFLVMFIASLILIGSSHTTLRKHEVLLSAGFTTLSLYMARNIPLYAIITAPYLGTLLQPALNGLAKLQQSNKILSDMEMKLKGFMYPVIAVLATAFLFISNVQIGPYKMGNQHDATRFPVEAASWLKENPQDGNMFNEFIWGGYLLYRLWPDQTVFIDGTTDFFGEALTREYSAVVSLEDGWQEIIKKYNVSWAIMPSKSPLVAALEKELGWQIIYQDSTATIIEKPAE